MTENKNCLLNSLVSGRYTIILLLLLYFFLNGDAESQGRDLESLKRRATQGDAVAMYKIGEVFYWGKDAPQDYPEALKWYRKAAENGNAKAMYKIGHMYHRYKGV